jgi:hypothetical protein
MEIDWRPSGGRGEYELAGQAGGYSSADLLNWTINLDLGAMGWRETELMVSDQGGKPRLRRVGDLHHIQRQLASALLLPSSRRDRNGLASGSPVMVEGRYLIQTVSLEDLEFDAGDEILRARASSILVGNNDSTATVDVSERAAQVAFLHERSSDLPATISATLNAHHAALAGVTTITPEVERLQKQLIKVLADDLRIPHVNRTDPVPTLLAFLGGVLPAVELPGDESPDEPEIRLETTKVWRLTARRGASMDKFRKVVMKAYDFTCAFCGAHLPNVKGEVMSGGQAAHILPYAEFDLDDVTNGMCLCPTHHWAFDEYLLVVDPVAGSYKVRVSDRAYRLLPAQSTAFLGQVAGIIPTARLPKKKAEWPRPEYFDRLYEDNPTD